MTRRTEQLASSIRRVVQTLLSRGLNDPRVRGLVSVTSVRLSDDMADATVYVSILPEDCAALTMHGLRQAAGHLQFQLGRALSMRRVPRLSFKLDESLKKQAAIDAAIAQAAGPEASLQPPPDSLDESESESGIRPREQAGSC